MAKTKSKPFTGTSFGPIVTSVHPALGGHAVSVRSLGKDYNVSVKNGMVTHHHGVTDSGLRASIGGAAIRGVEYAKKYGADSDRTITARDILKPARRR